MRRSLPPMTALLAFETTSRHLNITHAADEIGVSPSAVSQQIKKLEQWFKTDLLVRESGGVELTEPGERLARTVTRQNDELEHLCRDLSQEQAVKRMVITCDPTFSSKLLRQRLRALQDHLGKVEFSSTTLSTPPNKFPEQTDLLIHYGRRPKWANVVTIPVLEIHGFPACSPELLSELGPLDVPCDISKYRLLHEEDRSIWENWIRQNNVQSVCYTTGTFYDDFSLTIESAVAGEGVIIADPIFCAKELSNGTLVKLSDQEVFCATYYMSCRENALENATVRKMHAWLADELSATRTVASHF